MFDLARYISTKPQQVQKEPVRGKTYRKKTCATVFFSIKLQPYNQ